jgi:hypothetical protein
MCVAIATLALAGAPWGLAACDGGSGAGKPASSDGGVESDAALDGGRSDANDASPTPDASRAPDAGLSDGALDATPDATPDATTVAGYLTSLPGWPPPLPDSNGPVDGGPDAAPNYVTGTPGADGSAPLEYVCTTTEYSLTSTPTQIVTLDPNVDVLWPGALLQGGPLRNGALVGLPITQRAPITVSIPTLLSANNSRVVQNPSVATTENAIGALIDSAIDAGVQASSSVSYTQTEAFSASQVALSLGFSADYVGSHLSGDLNLSESANLHTVVGYFVQKMFTVTVPEPEQPADFFSGLTTDTLNQLIAEGDVGPTNLPVYVASVTYGRLMMFSITASKSTQAIETALSAQFNGLLASGSVDARYASLQSDSSFSFRVVTVGGSATDAEALIETGDPSRFFSSDPAISTGVPISYVVRNLGNNSIAGVSETTNYSVQTCQVTASGAGANYYVGDSQRQTIDGYDGAGAPVSFTQSFSPVGRPLASLSYASKEDEVFVLAGAPRTVTAFAPDGRNIGSFTPQASTGYLNGLSYDGTHDRLYVTATGGQVASYTPNGELIDQPSIGCVYQTLYVPSADALYCLNGPDGVSAYTFGSYDNVTLPADAFAAVTTPVDTTAGIPVNGVNGEYGAYDPVHDRLLIGNGADAWSFTPSGAQVAHFALDGHLLGIAYDIVDSHVAVALDNGTVALFDDDGTPVKARNASFSGIAQPTGIVFRP